MSNITVRPSAERGHADHGWLESRHTFSFAEYHDARHVHFRTLRVINEDRVAPGGGFGEHPHQDMEIFSYVLSGRLQHRDSLGNSRVLEPGQVQLMSAGTGVTHSEFNPSDSEPVHFLQIWILPGQRGRAPSYTEWHPRPGDDREPKVLIISSDGREGSARIHQDADVYRVRLESGKAARHELRAGRGAWLQVMRGEVELNGVRLQAGDGARVETAGDLAILARSAAEALLFDLK
jgi:hypothetical protein